MLVDLSEKLVNRCLQLLRHRHEQRQSLLASQVEPTLVNFEELHAVYMRIFREAHEEISQAPDPIIKTGEIGERLFRESLFNNLNRVRLLAQTFALRDDSCATRFIDALDLYLSTSGYWIFEDVASIGKAERLLARSNAHIKKSDAMNIKDYEIWTHIVMQNIRATVAGSFRRKILRGNNSDLEAFRAGRLEELERIVATLQQKYANVQLSYHVVKRELQT